MTTTKGQDYVALHAMGLPVWEGDHVVDTTHVAPGDTVTAEMLESARQDDAAIAVLLADDDLGGPAMCSPGEYASAQARLAELAEQESQIKRLRDLGFTDEAIDAAMAAQKGASA